jgi:hypothetical protein
MAVLDTAIHALLFKSRRRHESQPTQIGTIKQYRMAAGQAYQHALDDGRISNIKLGGRIRLTVGFLWVP